MRGHHPSQLIGAMTHGGRTRLAPDTAARKGLALDPVLAVSGSTE